MKLKIKFVAICLAVSMIPLFLVILVSRANTQEILLNKSRNFLSVLLDNKIGAIKTIFNEARETIFIKDDYLVRSNLALLVSGNSKIDANSRDKAVGDLDISFRRLAARHDEIGNIIFVAPSGNINYDLNRKISDKAIAKNFSGFGSLAFTNGQDKIYNTDLYPSGDGSAFLVSAPLYDNNDVFLGVLMIEINALNSFSINSDYAAYNTLETIITKQASDTAIVLNSLRFDSAAAFTREISLNSTSNKSVLAAASGNSGYGSDIDYRGQKVLAAWSYIPENNWGVVVKVDESEIFLLYQNFFNQILYLALFCALIIFFGTWGIALLVYAPIPDMIEALEKIGGGVFDIKFNKRTVLAKDELGILARVFLKTSEKLKELYSSLNNRIEAKSVELEARDSDLDNQKKALISLLEDVESEKSKAEGLANDLEKFRLAVENSSDYIIITDPDGIVIYGNKMVEKITGYSLSEIVGTDVAKLWLLPLQPGLYQKIWTTIKDEKAIFSGELRNKRKNGEEYDVVISVSPVFDRDGKIIYFAWVERDVTKEKQVDRAKSEFVSLISHQLRTPLTAINLFTEMLIDKQLGELNEEQTEYIKNISQSNQRMVVLVNSILNVSRLEMGTFIIEPKDTDVAELAQTVIDEQKIIMAEKKIKFKQLIDKKIPTIKTDPNHLRMVFQNLLSNATNYTPNGKNIELDITFDKVDDKILIAVKDEGIGIPKNQQSEIFSKLFRANNAQLFFTDGNGLGLYIVKTVVEQLGGKIWFESEENVGTSFFVSLSTAPVAEKAGTAKLS